MQHWPLGNLGDHSQLFEFFDHFFSLIARLHQTTQFNQSCAKILSQITRQLLVTLSIDQGKAKVLYEFRRSEYGKRKQKQIKGFLGPCIEKTSSSGKIGLL